MIEAADEVVFGVREAAWPLIRSDFGLSYAQIGFLLGVPSVAAAAIEPALGLVADSGRRHLIMVIGGCAFVAGLGVAALAPGFAWLLLGFMVIYPASGAFVGLAQASLIDLQPKRHEVNLARWTLAGSIGAVLGPLTLAAALAVGFGWRAVLVGIALLMVPLVGWARSAAQAPALRGTFATAARRTLQALRRWEVVRWLLVLEATNLMGDVLFGYLALYFVDVVGFPPPAAAIVLVVWTVAGLAGDALLLLILNRLSGLRYLRLSAVLVAFLFPALLLASPGAAKVPLLALLAILRAGWYAIPQGRLYRELEGESGTAMVLSTISAAAGSVLPIAIGLVAGRVGLQAALWIALLAPFSILALVPARADPD